MKFKWLREIMRKKVPFVKAKLGNGQYYLQACVNQQYSNDAYYKINSSNETKITLKSAIYYEIWRANQNHE
jgi:hypothetical protein